MHLETVCAIFRLAGFNDTVLRRKPFILSANQQQKRELDFVVKHTDKNFDFVENSVIY